MALHQKEIAYFPSEFYTQTIFIQQAKFSATVHVMKNIVSLGRKKIALTFLLKQVKKLRENKYSLLILVIY